MVADLAKNFGRLSKSQVNARRSKVPRKGVKAEAVVSAVKAPKFYGDAPSKKVTRKTNGTAKLRSSITPGTVLILLAGRFRGKRVVFLKQLESGLLLVSGPFKVNGVPLRRINQAYVIATSTKIDISSVSIDANFNDAYFAKEATKKSKGTEKEFFGEGADKKEKTPFPSDKSEDQKSIDKALLAEISKTENLTKYLGSTFSLSKGQYPHLLQF